MGTVKALLVAGAFSIGAAGLAQAADILPAAPRVEAPRMVEDDDFSSWYLRADVGIGIDRSVGLRSTPNPLTTGGAGFVPTAYSISDAFVSGTPFIGFGFGYRFNNWFRTDVTAEYRTSTFSARDELSWNNGGGQLNVLRNFYRGNMSSFVAMFNGYVDLGTWHGLTPFIGAGVGVANTRFTGLTDNGYNNLYAGAPFATSSTSGSYSSSNTTSFAWALMAGLGYKINSRLTLEMGYRYLNMGKVKSAIPNCDAAGPGTQACANIALQMKRSGTHDVRVGMRWNFNEPSPPVPFREPAPIVRKY